MKPVKVMVLGMELDRWKYKSCTADFGVGDDAEGNWATLYSIRSTEQGNGHATTLLKRSKKYYESLGKCFGGSVALNPRMREIYQRLKITEYK